MFNCAIFVCDLMVFCLDPDEPLPQPKFCEFALLYLILLSGEGGRREEYIFKNITDDKQHEIPITNEITHFSIIG